MTKLGTVNHWTAWWSWTVALLIPLTVVIASSVLTQATHANDSTMPWAKVHIDTAEGQRHSFRVEVAQIDAHRRQGLMFRWHLPKNEGMLFLFDQPRPVSMWMKNTFIPLTMLFVASDGRIVHVVNRTQPLSEDSIHSGQPVTAVLELAGGTASRLSLKPGARLSIERQ